MEKRVYKEEPMKIAVRVVFGVIGLFVLIGIFVSLTPSRPMTPSEKTGGIIGISAVLGVMFTTLMVAWLAIKKRTITVDLQGAEIVGGRPLGKKETEKFSWQEVSAVRIVSEITYARGSQLTSYQLSVVTSGRDEIFLMYKTWLNGTLRSLIRDVNEATRHLGYSWEECRDDGTRPILESVPPFCKISLDPSGISTQNVQTFSQAVSNRNVQSFAPTVKNPAIPKLTTKKQVRQGAIVSLVISLVLALGAGGFAYWDYREQVKFYNFWERGSGLDFKTGKPIPNYQPPPFEYRYDRMAFLPHIIIFGAVSLLMLFLAVAEFRKSAKMVETPEMLAADAEREKIENSPEAKKYARQRWLLALTPFALMIPIPFIAIYKLGIWVFLVYIIFVAIFVGAINVILPRRMSK